MRHARETRAEIGDRLDSEVARRGAAIRRAETPIEANQRMVRRRFEEDRPPARPENARRLAPNGRRIDIHQEVLAVDEIDAGLRERQPLGVGTERRDAGGEPLALGARGDRPQADRREFGGDNARPAPGEAECAKTIARAEFEECAFGERAEGTLDRLARVRTEAPEGVIGLPGLRGGPFGVVSRR